MPVKSVYMIVGGRVHGVGFRYFARHKAEEMQISGCVRNTPEGKVEIEAEGDSQNLEIFIEWIRIGPARAIIRSFSVSEVTPLRNFTGFKIQ